MTRRARLTGLDAAFLALETPSNHMHVMAVAVLDPTDVPGGFATTADAYRDTLEHAGAWPRLRAALAGLDASNLDDLAARAQLAREIVHAAPMPDALVGEIRAAYA